MYDHASIRTLHTRPLHESSVDYRPARASKQGISRPERRVFTTNGRGTTVYWLRYRGCMLPSKSCSALAVEDFDQEEPLREEVAGGREDGFSVRQLEVCYGDGDLPKLSGSATASIRGASYTRLKRVFDIAACLCLLPFAGVLLLLLTLVVFMSAGFPVIYRQERVGQNGKRFTLYKFRTMRTDGVEHLSEWFTRHPEALKEWKAAHKLRNDPRIIRGGRFLRKTSLDELPQLFNVLRGEMTLVGPRPIVPAELVKYGSRVNFYLAALPGLTGLWQTSGRNNVSYNQRVDLDEEYVRQWSFRRDLQILLRTPMSVLRGDGAC